MRRLAIGDRVRVVDDYFVAYLRGVTGKITAPDESLCNHIAEGQLWVEFDALVPDENGALTEAGAFTGLDLQLVQ